MWDYGVNNASCRPLPASPEREVLEICGVAASPQLSLRGASAGELRDGATRQSRSKQSKATRLPCYRSQ